MINTIVTVEAPCTVANLNAGFDILGFSLSILHDTVSIKRLPEKKVVIKKITTQGGESIPTEEKLNTASVALLSLMHEENLPHGFEISIHKGIPLSSGLGGSAASAVAAVVGANQLLDSKLPFQKLFHHALKGEEKASGGMHGDNVAPSLMGGVTACLQNSKGGLTPVSIQLGSNIFCTIFHPHTMLETKQARGILRPDLLLKDHVRQSMHLAGLILGLQNGDFDLIRDHLHDVIITPQRKKLLPHYDLFSSDLAKSPALGFGISGAGPSLFALSRLKSEADEVGELLKKLAKKNNLGGDTFVGQMGQGLPRISVQKVEAP